MKRLVPFVTGVVVGAILFASSFSYAFSGKKTGELIYSDIKILINGSLLRTELEPFSIAGRVYVPLRVVADALNQNVGWENNTVLIGSGRQSLLLTDLVNPSVRLLDVGDFLTVNGNTARGFYALGKQSQKSGSVEFFVQKKGIKEINGSIVLDDNNPEDIQPANVKISLDNVIVWEGTVAKDKEPSPINIKLDENSSRLVIELDNLNKTKVDFIDFICKY